ncbi:hypothetical protein C7212DRAFT_359906 [Tuber magnatum]|uniref:Uncharacterized protein n=1 Tax=Tuber magnatum TaxID=42249 RepID=A0A317SHE1_9PEZI|nr:hypothetical protein C7212DRAFT_359906 [Tuber magnatum]
MFCLRSWLPLLFIPTSASPAFIVLFLICTYLFHRPCVYCSLIMLTLFSSSCYWSDRCFLDSNDGHWFEPRFLSSAAGKVLNAAAGAVGAGGGAAVVAAAAGGAGGGVGGEEGVGQVWTGIGLDWLRTMCGRREWRVGCLDVVVRL